MKCMFSVDGLDWDFFKETDLLEYEVFRSVRREPLTSSVVFLERIHLALSSKCWNECVTAFIFQKYFMIGKGDWLVDLAKQIWGWNPTHLEGLGIGKGGPCTKMPWPSSHTEKLHFEFSWIFRGVFFFSSLFFIINALNSVIFVNVSKCLILKSTNSRSKLVYKTKRPSLLGSLWFGLYSKIQSIEKCPAFLELCSQQRNAQCEENIYLCDVVSEIPAHSWELTLCLGPAVCPGVFLAQDSSSCRMEP